MTEFNEFRDYKLCSSRFCKVFMSIDRHLWKEFDYDGISAAGLSFMGEDFFEIDTRLYLNLSTYYMLTEFSMSFEGIIIDKTKSGNQYQYKLKFDKIDRHQQLKLNEIIKLHASTYHENELSFDDGMYTFLFIPEGKRITRKVSSC